jgi:hypothetical protein
MHVWQIIIFTCHRTSNSQPFPCPHSTSLPRGYVADLQLHAPLVPALPHAPCRDASGFAHPPASELIPHAHLISMHLDGTVIWLHHGVERCVQCPVRHQGAPAHEHEHSDARGSTGTTSHALHKHILQNSRHPGRRRSQAGDGSAREGFVREPHRQLVKPLFWHNQHAIL